MTITRTTLLLFLLIPILATAQPTWIEHVVTDSLDGVHKINPADVNGDGTLDIIGAGYGAYPNFAGRVAWYEQSGNGWVEHIIDDNIQSVQSAIGADMDSDGDIDIIASSRFEDCIYIYRQNQGSWTKSTMAPSLVDADEVYVADFTGDGHLDLVGCGWDRLRWYENMGNGVMIPQGDVINEGAYSAVAALINTDNTLDIVAGLSNSDLMYFKNLYPADWQEYMVSEQMSAPMTVSTADMDDDGDTDILCAAHGSNGVYWFSNEGDHWDLHHIRDNLHGAINACAADLDLDGELEVVATANFAGIVAYYDYYDFEWVEHIISDFDYGYDVMAVDFDNDGDIDIAAASESMDKIVVWEQEGTPPPPVTMSITLTPAVTPVVVHRGETFHYDLHIEFELPNPTLGHIWGEAVLPNGNVYGPVFDLALVFGSNMDITITDMTQFVPYVAPFGDYTWRVRVGTTTGNPLVGDNFPFSVVYQAGEVTRPGNGWSNNANEKLGGLLFEQSTGETELPGDMALAITPNPFNEMTRVSVQTSRNGEATIDLFDVLGRRVETLHTGPLSSGAHTWTWDASSHASGVYLLRVTQADQTLTQKLVLLR